MTLTLTVGIPPGFGLLRREDLEAVRAAAMYADHVRVVMHLATHMVTGLIVGAPEDERAAFLQRCTAPAVIHKAGYPAEATALTRELAALARDYAVLHKPGLVGLDLVLEDGVYQEAILEGDEPALVVRIDPGPDRWVERLAELAQTEPGSHIVLPVGGPLADALAPEAWHKATGTKRASLLGLEFLSRLPRFSGASLDEILDIRVELEPSLVRFRAALVELARAASESPPDIESIFIGQVEPAIAEILEATSQNRYLRRLAERLLSPTDGLVSFAGLGVTVTTLGGVPEIVATAVAMSMPFLRAAWDRKLHREDQEKHQFFFLYGVRHSLDRREQKG